MTHHNIAQSGAWSRMLTGVAIGAVVLSCSISKTAAAQIGGVTPIFSHTTPPPFAPAGGFLGINISWDPTICVTPMAMVVSVGARTYSTTWSRTSGIGVMPATFALSGGRSYVVSDDKTHRLNNPTLTVDCINIQWKVS